MADVNANIGVNIDTSEALGQLKALQRQISQFHTAIAKSSEAAGLAQKDLQRNFLNSVNSIGSFSAELRTVKTTAESFTDSLEKNKFSMRNYFSYAAASTKTFGKLFKSEYDTIGKVAEERVKTLQTQYVQMGRDANGAMKAIAIRPLSLDMNNLSTQTQIAAQKQALFNQLMKQGSTNLLNFGKNTQWAGRQLMVGFSLPLMAVGSAASKTFMQMEAQALKFKKVYGDIFTPQAETQQALDGIKQLGKEFTKYGIAVSDTVGLAADAAAAGFKGIDLQRQTAEATRLSVLGQIDNQKALQTTISLQNAFGTSSADLANSIDFLNAVENQTVLSLDDVTTAIPKVAPVIKQLGGNVKDLAFFLTAMKEGGVNASEGANALKSGLASLINPTRAAREMLQGLGIDINGIVEKDKGDLKKTVIDFAQALDTLSPLQRARAIEQMFGKFQFARLSTLFQNVTKDGTQASKVLELTGASVSDLASLSSKELGITADSAMNKFKKSVEDLKAAIVPVGEAFLKVVTPILDFVSKIAEKFASLSDGTKKAITVMVAVIGGLGPILLMTFGLLANGVANIIKLFLTLRTGYQKLTGQSQNLGEQTQYLTTEQMNAEASAHSLERAHAKLTQQFTVQREELDRLIAAYSSATSAASRFAAINPGMMSPPKKKFAGGGIVHGPGSGTSDSVPIMASNGEAVIDAETVNNNKQLIDSLLKTGEFKPKIDLSGSPATVARSSFSYRGVNSLILGKGLPGATVGGLPGSNTQGAVAKNMPPIKIERAHATGAFAQESKQFQATLDMVSGLRELNTKFPGMIRVVSNLTAELPVNLNQAMKEITLKNGKLSGGVSTTRFGSEYGTLRNKFNASAARGGANINDPQIQSQLNLFEEAVGKRAIEIANGTEDLKVTDTIFEKATRETIDQFKIMGGKAAIVSDSLDKVSKQVGQVRIQPSQAQYRQGLSSGDFSIDQSGKIAKFGNIEVARPTRNTKAGLPSARPASNINFPGNYVVGKNLSIQAEEIANNTIEATRKGAGTASPSKKTIPIGEDIARGLQVGMANQQSKTEKAGESLSNGIISGARRATRAQGAPMSNVTEQIISSPKTGQDVAKFSKNIGESTPKLIKMNNAIMGGSFALTSLAGITQMFGGTLGRISSVVFNLSGVLFGLMTVTQLLTQAKAMELVSSRLAMAKQAAAFSSYGKGLSESSGFIGMLTRAAIGLRTFLGPVGLATAAIGALYVGFKLIQAAQKREYEAINGLADAMKTTSEQAKALGDYFNIIPRKSAREIGPQSDITGTKQRTALEDLKSSDTFKKQFGGTIKQIANATKQEAELALTSISLDLKSKGFASEQIQLIVDALREEAKKTDIKLDVKSLDFSPKGIDELKKKTVSEFASIASSGANGYRTVFEQKSNGFTTVLVKKLVPTKELKREYANLSTFIASTADSAGTMFKNNDITAAQYEQTLLNVTSNLSNLDSAQKSIILNDMFKKLGVNSGPFLSSLKTAKQEMEMMALLSAGIIDKNSNIISNLSSSDKDAQERGRRQLAYAYKGLSVIENTVKEQNKLNEAQGTGKGTSSDILSKQAKLTIARLQKELDLLKTKKETIDQTNNELKRQYDYQQKLMQLQKDAIQAKISGDYIGASIIGQQQSFETGQFNKETDSLALDKKITALENRISGLQAGARVTAAETALNKARNKATGGLIVGPGTGTSDSITARFAMGGLPQLHVSNGEYIVKSASVQKYGVGFMDAVNNGRLSSTVQSPATAGNTVYNIDMTINGGNQNPRDIADQVIRRLKVETSKNNKTNKVAF